MAENSNPNRWTGIFFDGGLCVKGDPNPIAISLVKRLLEAGETVKVIAPRIKRQGEDDGNGGQRDPIGHLKQWCNRRFGVELPLTTEIDHDMVAIHGTRCRPLKVRKPGAKKAAKKKTTAKKTAS